MKQATVIMTIFVFSQLLLLHGQAFRIDNAGKLYFNGQTGKGIYTPQFNIFSQSTGLEGMNGALNLCNTDKVPGNTIRLSFLTMKDNNGIEDYANIGVRFLDRSESNKSGELHLSTLNYAKWNTRFSINPGGNANIVTFKFNTETGGGAILLVGSTTLQFSPVNSNSGSLGTSLNRWNAIYATKPYFSISSTVLSDYREKSNIRNIDNKEMAKLSKLNGITYHLISQEDNKNKMQPSPQEYGETENGKRSMYDKTLDDQAKIEWNKQLDADAKKKYYGFIAQEVKDIYPELVEYDVKTEKYGIRYTEFIPIIVEAMKGQQAEIERLSAELKILKEQSETSYQQINIPSQTTSVATVEQTLLFQNTPNPFNKKTELNCFLPMRVLRAKLVITNLSGKTVKSLILRERGNLIVNISAGELPPGVYLYSLIVEDVNVDTKRMVITEF